eukprot:2663627-Pyramimonas_sp.AAC.1
MIVFADNWYPVNGVMNYVEWKKGKNGKKDEFFTDGALVTHAIVGRAMCKHQMRGTAYSGAYTQLVDSDPRLVCVRTKRSSSTYTSRSSNV